MSNYMLLLYVDEITYPCHNFNVGLVDIYLVVEDTPSEQVKIKCFLSQF